MEARPKYYNQEADLGFLKKERIKKKEEEWKRIVPENETWERENF